MPRNPTEEFKKLQDKWYAKLKKQGFEDKENARGELKVYDRYLYGTRTEENDDTWTSAKSEYYRLAEHFLNEFKFKDSTEKFIWSRHSEGDSVRTITKAGFTLIKASTQGGVLPVCAQGSRVT